MSNKNLDQHGRFRSKHVGFRMSPEEAFLLDKKVIYSGLKKQDYLIQALLNDEKIVLKPTPYAVQQLKRSITQFLESLNSIELTQLSANELETAEYLLKQVRQLLYKK